MIESLQEEYEQEGYIILEQVFSQEQVDLLKNEIMSVVNEVKNESDSGSNDKTESEVLIKQGVLIGLAQKSPLFKEVTQEQKIMDVLKEIMGNTVAFMGDKVVFKNAETDFGSPWHQDWPYWKGSHKASVWIALDNATPENGCLKIIPGSHKQLVTHEEKDGKGFTRWISPNDIDESKADALPVQAGSVIIFHDLLLHASYPNTSGDDRIAIINTYKSNTWNWKNFPNILD